MYLFRVHHVPWCSQPPVTVCTGQVRQFAGRAGSVGTHETLFATGGSIVQCYICEFTRREDVPTRPPVPVTVYTNGFRLVQLHQLPSRTHGRGSRTPSRRLPRGTLARIRDGAVPLAVSRDSTTHSRDCSRSRGGRTATHPRDHLESIRGSKRCEWLRSACAVSPLMREHSARDFCCDDIASRLFTFGLRPIAVHLVAPCQAHAYTPQGQGKGQAPG